MSLEREVFTQGQHRVTFQTLWAEKGEEKDIQSDVASGKLPGEGGLPGDFQDLKKQHL